MSPRLKPVATLNVRGVATNVRKAGNPSLKSSHCTRTTDLHISAPTSISAGAVAYEGIALTSGEKNGATRNSAAIATLPSPVRAPAATPAALSKEFSLLAHADQRAHIVKQVHKEEYANDLDQTHVHGPAQVELQPGTRGMRQRKEVTRPLARATEHAGDC